MRSIKRTIVQTGCIGQRMDATGKFVEVAEILDGKYTRQRAQAKLRKKLHDETINVSFVELHTTTLRLSGDDFLKYAVEVDE